MKNFKILIIFAIFFIRFEIQAQDTLIKPTQIDIFSLGVGGGLDYGGFGGNLLFYPYNKFGLFAGAGYAIAGVGYNVGFKVRLVKEQKFSKINMYFQGMYGYNAAIAVEGATYLNKLFYGPSFGLGADFQSRPVSKGYWSFALLVPIRSAEVNEYIDDLKTNHGVEFKNGLFPVGFSIGYRFIMSMKYTNAPKIEPLKTEY